MEIFIAFTMAVITFYVNSRIRRMIDIKVVINALFELYGQPSSITKSDPSEINRILSNEILSLEKMYDENETIKEQVEKVKELRALYFHFDENTNFEEGLNKIGFQKLGRGFIILSYLNLHR